MLVHDGHGYLFAFVGDVSATDGIHSDMTTAASMPV